ncbi:M56 family metallopeptidase [Streptosporangium sp. NBC_01495]|uniref:M56 family metallopeptidase n=1 Tax=Streptosporangium sp. NBC_01495 TaxID=2903899 RepID=UPI002E3135BF|nr:M56 family metallopeptidase [Streptosporangium sp. NBC_01495]
MTAWTLAAGIALLPLLLGGQVTVRLASAAWTSRRPRAALVLWQAIGLSAGLGAFGLGLIAAVAPLAAAFPHGAHVLGDQIVDGRGLSGLGWGHVAALLWSLSLPAWLLAHTARTLTRAAAGQRRQRLLIDLVADLDRGYGAYVLPEARPVAYCVPGRQTRVVVSRGTLERLSPRHVHAVLAHERAHARGHHDLVLLPFAALAQAFPILSAPRTAMRAVSVLLEMLADDQARRHHGDLVLAQAIVQMITPGEQQPAHTLALTQLDVAQRLQRLLTDAATPGRGTAIAAYSAAAGLLSGPLTVLVAPIICTLL